MSRPAHHARLLPRKHEAPLVLHEGLVGPLPRRLSLVDDPLVREDGVQRVAEDGLAVAGVDADEHDTLLVPIGTDLDSGQRLGCLPFTLRS